MQQALQSLIGLPLTYMWRPVSQCFEFGEQLPFINSQGQECTRADRDLTIWDADWRISKGDVIVMGHGDHRGKRRFYDRKTAPRDPEQRERWLRANRFFHQMDAGQLVVSAVAVGRAGSLKIELALDYAIDVLPCGTEGVEWWSYTNDDNRKRYSVGSDGIEVGVQVATSNSIST